MRSCHLVLGGCLILGLSGPASAQTVQYQATVMAQGAEVHCKPGTGKEIYVTNHLRHGDVVQVVGDHDDGWLEIVPPAGSFSWINARDIQHPLDWIKYPNNYLVSRDGSVPVFIGSSVDAGSRHTVVGVQLPKGSQVARVALDTVKDHDGDWVRIQPPANEVRYIRAEMVKKFDAPMVVQNAGQGYTGAAAVTRVLPRDQRVPAAGAESLSCQLCPAAASERRGGAVAAGAAGRACRQRQRRHPALQRAGIADHRQQSRAGHAGLKPGLLAARSPAQHRRLDRAAGAGPIRARNAGQRGSLRQRRPRACKCPSRLRWATRRRRQRRGRPGCRSRGRATFPAALGLCGTPDVSSRTAKPMCSCPARTIRGSTSLPNPASISILTSITTSSCMGPPFTGAICAPTI